MIITKIGFQKLTLLSSFERNCRDHYSHTELVVLNETLYNHFADLCEFLVFCSTKPGKEGLEFRTLGDCKDRYISRIETCVRPAMNHGMFQETKIKPTI